MVFNFEIIQNNVMVCTGLPISSTAIKSLAEEIDILINSPTNWIYNSPCPDMYQISNPIRGYILGVNYNETSLFITYKFNDEINLRLLEYIRESPVYKNDIPVPKFSVKYVNENDVKLGVIYID